MNYLFIHQNFPGQFKHLAPSLAKLNTVVALRIGKQPIAKFFGVNVISYDLVSKPKNESHHWLTDLNSKIYRAEACYVACMKLKNSGFTPDVIICHPGWGESLFVNKVWPAAKIGIYCEFHYQIEGADIGFDPEFSIVTPELENIVELRNINNHLHFKQAALGISPTQWQANTFPEEFKDKVSVIHDGINTQQLIPNSNVRWTLNGHLDIDRTNPIVTFINRNLEPYRGYHSFMRSLPFLLKANSSARIMIVGSDQVSYGAKPPNSKSWKNIFFEEIKPQLTQQELQRIHFLGRIPYQDYIALLQLSTVHVYLSYPFVLSWSLLEAMSCGCSIVASDTKPVLEVINNNDNGVLVDFFKPEQIAKQVCDLLENPAMRKKWVNKHVNQLLNIMI